MQSKKWDPTSHPYNGSLKFCSNWLVNTGRHIVLSMLWCWYGKDAVPTEDTSLKLPKYLHIYINLLAFSTKRKFLWKLFTKMYSFFPNTSDFLIRTFAQHSSFTLWLSYLTTGNRIFFVISDCNMYSDKITPIL